LTEDEDKDFGDLAFRLTMAVPGVVLLRLGLYDSTTKWVRLEAAISHFGSNLFGRFVVVEDKRFRSRPLLRPI
jgi:hypothetical protein